MAVDYRRTRVVLHKNITSPCVHVSISEWEFRVRTEASQVLILAYRYEYVGPMHYPVVLKYYYTATYSGCGQ